MVTYTLADLRRDVRSLVLEPAAHMFLDSELSTWLSLGIRDFSSRVLWYSRIVAKDVIANQFEYDLPADILKLELIRWNEQYRPRVLDEAEWSAATFLQTDVSKTYPDFAFLYPHDKRLAIYPKPSATSPATTLNGALTAVATTITVASTAAFPTKGYLLIENEQVRYFATTATQFLLCRRGDGDTTAAAHADLVAVKSGQLQLYVRALPPDLTLSGDIPKLPDEYIEALTLYCGYRAYLKRQLYNEAGALNKLYLQKREEAMREREQATFDSGGGVKDQEYQTGYFSDAY